MKFNMILAAVLCAGIIAMLSGFVSRQLVAAETLPHDAVKIEVAEAAASGAPKAAAAEPVLALVATADAAKGKTVAKACAACHSFEKGAPNGVGPNLYGILGRKKESVAGFAYSGSLKAQGGDTWTHLELNKFLWKPKAYASGTKMSFIGVKKPEDRAALLAYLQTLGEHPAPTQTEIDAEAQELGGGAAAPAAAPADTPAAH